MMRNTENLHESFEILPFFDIGPLNRLSHEEVTMYTDVGARSTC